MWARPRRFVCFLALAGAACTPRQAVIETDPRGGGEVRRQLEASARNDLDALRRAQEEFRSREATYTYRLPKLHLEPSAGVSLNVVEATANGFAAIARAGSIECGLFVGSADPPRRYTAIGGVVACRSPLP